MSAKVHTDFTSDGKQLIKTLQDSQKQIEKLTAENKKLADQSKRATQEVQGGFESAADSVAGMVGTIGAVTGGLATAQTLTRLVAAEFDDWRKRVDALKDSTTGFHEKLVADLRSSGQLAQAEKIDRTLTGVSGTTREQMQAMFSGIAESGPVGVDRALELAQAAAPRAQSGESADRLREFGSVLGEMGDVAVGRSPGDVADLTAKLQEATRGDFKKFGGAGSVRALGKLTTGGMPIEQALGWAAAAMDVGVDPKTLGQVAAQAKAAGLSFDEAVANPKRAKLGDQVASSLSLIDRNVVMQRAEEFRRAQTDNVIERSAQDLAKSQAGLMVGMRQTGQSAFDKSKALSADATIEEIIANIDTGYSAFKNAGDRTFPAMTARYHTWTGDLPAEAALKAYGGSQSKEYRAVHSPEENAFWDDTIRSLKELVTLQREANEKQKQSAPVSVNLKTHGE